MNIKQSFPTLSTEELASVDEVFRFGFLHLNSILRRSGESYAQHGLEVAQTIAETNPDPTLIRVAILHDLFLHPKGESLIKESPLNEDEQQLARKMHQLRRLFIDTKTHDLDKFIHSFIDDERLLLLRMAHRLNDVRKLSHFKPGFRKQIAHETLHMYTAIASRLGMHAWCQEMEDLCFKVVHPVIAQNLELEFKKYQKADQNCLDEAQKYLKDRLEKQGIKCRIEGRIKGLYSTYRKMLLKHRKFNELTDRLAIRVILDDYIDCYQALGLVHAYMHPIPGKLKDYIGAPKENGYQSIHTVVYPLTGVNEQPIEIQIRTELMNEICEYGPAAHADYKKSKYKMAERLNRVDLFRNILHLHQGVSTPQQFEKALRSYFDNAYIGIFDDKDRLYHLKKPATVLDFICHAYPNRFKRLKAVWVNGRPAEVEMELKDGDVVKPDFKMIKPTEIRKIRIKLLQPHNQPVIKKIIRTEKNI